MRVKTMTLFEGGKVNIDDYPNFHKSGNIQGMKENVYGKNTLLVRCGSYIYNVSSNPSIYYNLAH